MKKCKFCGSKNINGIKRVKSPHLNSSYTLYHCHSCGSRFFNILEHQVDIEQLYADLGENSAKIYQPYFKRNKKWESQKKHIIKHLGHSPNSILDVGCRFGDFLLHFENCNIREGVEISNIPSKIAKERGLTVYSDFLENIKFNKKYEVVTSYAILEHLVAPFNFLSKLKTIIVPNGILVILIPTHQCFKEKLLNIFNKRWHMYSPPEHLNFYSTQFLDEYLEEQGFTLAKRYYTSGGIFNPFSKIPILNKIFGDVMKIIDKTYLNKLPIFDHMYCIYRFDRS
jgi:SAM-dependent methyltransferase